MPIFNGDAANNLLDARSGGNSNDTLDGGLGADTMWGGDGSDLYYVDNVGDVVEEFWDDATGGNDTVIASVSYSLDIAPTFSTRGIENLVLTGSVNINGTGNVLYNSITGNDGNNLLSGLGGNDTLTGGGGNDTLLGGEGNDSFVGGAGVDSMQGDGGTDFFNLNGTADLTGWVVDGGADVDTADLAAVNVQLGASLPFTGIERIEAGGTVLRGTAGDDNYDFTGITPLSGGSEYYFAVYAGEGNDTITAAVTANSWYQESYGEGGNDSIVGGATLDYMLGGDGNDTLIGGAGNDVMYGGNGNDVYVTGAGNDFIDENGDGTDLVVSSATHTLGADFENLTLTGTDALNGTGNGLDNLITGNEGTNQLSGGDGSDTLDGGAGADTLNGGAGNDRYLIDNAADVATESDNDSLGGVDTVVASVTYALTGPVTGQPGFGIENITLTGSADIDATGNASANTLVGNGGANELRGGAGDDSLQGDAGNDVLTGSSGADTLDGGTGIDAMVGGDGSDLYRVDNAGDLVQDTGTNGTDTVESLLSFTLASGLENLTLIGVAAINGTGNAGANTLVGNAAANILSGAGGADAMTGGDGNDTYVVDSVGDTVSETATSATQIDTVRSAVTWTLAANFENLVLTGTTAINGTGNTRANTITGNSAVNTLNGSTGNDTLDGGTGADSLVGGSGNDTYVVDVAGDKTIEGTLASEIDLVRAGLSWTLTTNVENLTLTGTGAFTGTGNLVANVLTGNTGANTLLGLAGADRLDGGAGNDTLDGGIGNDTLTGGTGADTFRFANTLSATTNVDAVSGFVRADDRFLLDDAVFAGIGAVGALALGAFRTGTAALERDDRIIYNKAQGKIYFDADGFGGAAQVLFATVAVNTDIRADDFFIG
jgi:Ca2+-binding RTX toxin-like protein